MAESEKVAPGADSRIDGLYGIVRASADLDREAAKLEVRQRSAEVELTLYMADIATSYPGDVLAFEKEASRIIAGVRERILGKLNPKDSARFHSFTNTTRVESANMAAHSVALARAAREYNVTGVQLSRAVTIGVGVVLNDKVSARVSALRDGTSTETARVIYADATLVRNAYKEQLALIPKPETVGERKVLAPVALARIRSVDARKPTSKPKTDAEKVQAAFKTIRALLNGPAREVIFDEIGKLLAENADAAQPQKDTPVPPRARRSRKPHVEVTAAA